MSDQSRRSRPLGAAAAPRAASPAIAVVIALVAAVLGFFILRQLDNNNDSPSTTPEIAVSPGDSSGSTGEPQDSVPVDPNASVAPPVSVTLPVPDPKSYTVVVANGSGLPGAAGALSVLLSVQGLVPGTATNILDSLPKLAVSEVYFTPGNDAQGAAVAKILGCQFTAQPMAATPPVDPAALVGVAVLIVQGTDLATSGVLQPCVDGAAAAPAAPTATAAAEPATS